MNINYNAIIVVLLFAGLVIALIAHRSESKRERFSLGVDLILRLDNFFNSPEFRKTRRRVATMLLSGGPQKKTETAPLDEILNFFETVGLLMLRDALNDEVVWNIFFSYMRRYKLCAKDYIDAQRKKDPTIWEHFIKVYEHLKEIEKRKRGLSDKDLRLSEKERDDFLEEESVR